MKVFVVSFSSHYDVKDNCVLGVFKDYTGAKQCFHDFLKDEGIPFENVLNSGELYEDAGYLHWDDGDCVVHIECYELV